MFVFWQRISRLADSIWHCVNFASCHGFLHPVQLLLLTVCPVAEFVLTLFIIAIMTCICVPGLYATLPLQIIVNSSVPCSSLSTGFAFTQTVTTKHRVACLTCSGPFSVPTVDGWFHSQFPLQVAHLHQGDLLLGADWVGVCQPQFRDGGIFRPSQNITSSLPNGHSWIESLYFMATPWLFNR